MEKEKWIQVWTSGKWAQADPDVIRFIADILYHKPYATNSTYQLFQTGYCYYFARMLQDAFGRGELMWHVKRDHIVWQDTDGTLYDSGGIYRVEDRKELIPVKQMGKTKLAEFKHVPHGGT